MLVIWIACHGDDSGCANAQDSIGLDEDHDDSGASAQSVESKAIAVCHCGDAVASVFYCLKHR